MNQKSADSGTQILAISGEEEHKLKIDKNLPHELELLKMKKMYLRE